MLGVSSSPSEPGLFSVACTAFLCFVLCFVLSHTDNEEPALLQCFEARSDECTPGQGVCPEETGCSKTQAL